MLLECLASSSSGNCYFVRFENSASILLEAGISIPEIKKKLFYKNIIISEIDAVLISHNHKDHSKSARNLSRNEFLKVWGNSMVCSENELLEPLKSKWITSKIEVVPFAVEHDAENTLGYVILAGNEKLLFVTDCKYFKTDIYTIPFDYVMIECNYSSKIVHTLNSEAKKNNDLTSMKRYNRLLNSHMSDRTCLKILKKMNLTKCKGVFLMHLSDGHSNEHELKHEFNQELNVPVYICKKHGGIL